MNITPAPISATFGFDAISYTHHMNINIEAINRSRAISNDASIL